LIRVGPTGTEGGSDEVDRMIEEGLARYGRGDVDGALDAWEHALAIDPDDTRAIAYVDYVRENYEVLAGTPIGERNRGTVTSENDDYIVEVTNAGSVPTPAPSAAALDAAVPMELAAEPRQILPAAAREMNTQQIERYIESVDEGWFLEDERGSSARNKRPSGQRLLPLPAEPEPAEITLTIEADEPERDEAPRRDLEPSGEEEAIERTGAFRPAPLPVWRTEPLDFDRNVPETQEIPAPRTTTAPPADELELTEDRLLTRPGRAPGSALDEKLELSRGIAAEAIAALTRENDRSAGPDELTRESPFVRVTFKPETQELVLRPDTSGDGDEELTTERAAYRLDTLSEPTSERVPRGRSYTRPDPIDEEANAPASGRHPPLVIIDDPVLVGAPEAPPLEPLDGEPDPVPEPVALGAGFGPSGPPSRRRASSVPPVTIGRPKSPSEKHRAPTLDPDRDVGEELEPSTVRERRAATATAGQARHSIEETAHLIEAALERDADPAESPSERTRRRVGELIDRACQASVAGSHSTAIVALDLALSEDPGSAITQKLLHRHQPAILDVYQRYLGDLDRRPHLAMPMHELSGEKLDIRAAFLLSRIDGNLSFEEILDVSGMQRAEAFRHLANLLLRGILTV
jgi:hypothetical protein